MDDHARVAIIGAGIAGCSVAFSLAQMGWTDVVVLEKLDLSSGSTWHAAGLCTQVNASPEIARLMMESLALYDRVASETGQSVGLKRVGSLRVASSVARVDELRALAGRLRPLGLPYEIVAPDRIQELWPLIEREGLLAAAHTPTDGYVDPSSVVQALAASARSKGVRIQKNARVQGLVRLASGEWEVQTAGGTIRAEIVVNAAGQWAGELSNYVGAPLPLLAMEHEYVVTDAIPDLAGRQEELPVLRDPDRSIYARQEGHGLIVGVYELDARTWGSSGIPESFGQDLLPPDLDRIQPELERAAELIPPFANAGIRTVYNGPDAYTPDDRPLVGPVPGFDNYYVIAGFSSSGIAAGGGTGQALARWIVQGAPDRDIHEIDVRRFGPTQTTTGYLTSRLKSNYAKHYGLHYPDEELPGGRPLRTDPLYDRLAARGAVFGERFGWERPIWFDPRGTTARHEETFRVGASFGRVAEECLAVRDSVGVIDQSSFAKFFISGPGAAESLDRIVASRLPAIGRIAYSLLLNDHAGIEADVTLARLDDEQFYLVTAAASETHDRDWLARVLPSGIRVDTATAARGVLSLAGPKSRELLQSISSADLSNRAFPFFSWRSIEIGMAEVFAMRVSFTGELGFELHVPIDLLRHVYDTVLAAGQSVGLRDVGYHALASLRLEKGYRLWGEDITPETTPFEAGLDRFVDFEKRDFVGRPAAFEASTSARPLTLATFVVDTDDAHPRRHEGVYSAGAGAWIGRVASGAYGHRIDAALANAYVPTSALSEPDGFELEVLGERRPARLVDACQFDPSHSRQRG